MKSLFDEVNKLFGSIKSPGEADKFVIRWAEAAKTFDALEKIPGDAGLRRYYRLRSGNKNFILMKRDPFTEEEGMLPFIEVQKHLSAAGVRVPHIYEFDSNSGVILLEDLGDVTLLRRLQNVSDQVIELKLYQYVINQLVDLQTKASPGPRRKHITAFEQRFDEEKLMWEVNFTIEHFYEKHLSRKIKPEHRQIIDESFGEICAELDRQPQVFVHRDFHSRNIMVKSEKGREKFILIDFQDARMGPAQYDLASLLRDSYYQLEEKQVQSLLDYYIDRVEKRTRRKIKKKEFKRVFDLMAIQRNFKAIGSFASFLNRRNNPTYLKYIGNTFENIRRALLKHPQYSDLREVLFHYYYF